MRIVALADTHLFTDDLVVPDGDLVIHAGDLLRLGSFDELQVGVQWLAEFPHRHKIFVAGNHDRCFEEEGERARAMLPDGWVYLEDDGIEIEGLKIWGSPWQPEFLGWAFNLPRGQALADKWALIPDDTDLLITHGPPHGFGDRAWGKHLGCRELIDAVRRVRPTLHCFGHIHEDRGVWDDDGVTIANVTTDEGDEPATVFDWDGSRLVQVAVALLAVVVTTVTAADAGAQESDVDAGAKDSRDAGTSKIVIEGLWDEDPANLRAPAWKRTEKPDPIERSYEWVKGMFDRSTNLVLGLQQPAQYDYDLQPYFRTAIRYQAAAFEALKARDLEPAAFLTMKARAIVREGFDQENAIHLGDFEDAEGELKYAAQTDPEDAVPYLKKIYDEWDHRDASPFRAPHHFRFEL